MLSQIANLVIDTIGSLFVYVLLLRFHMQWTRAPFRNPVGQMIAALTNWIVLPVRRVVPGLWGLDMATLLLAWLAQGLLTAVLMAVHGHAPGGASGAAFLVLAAVSAVELLIMSVKLLIGAAIVQAVLSFISPHSVLAPVLDALTRLFYAPFRRVLPPLGGVDLSPLFLVLAAQIAIIVLERVKAIAAGLFL